MNTAINANEIVINDSQNAKASQRIIEKTIENVTEQTKTQNEQEKKTNEEFICPECKKVCKSKVGLTAHMRTHQK